MQSTGFLARWLRRFRERRVPQMLAVYLVGAWIALQVCDVVVLPAFGIPEAGMRYLLMGATLGFGITFALAWRFQITPAGLRRHEITTAGRSAIERMSRADWAFIASMLATVTLSAGLAVSKLIELSVRDEHASSVRQITPRAASPGTLAVLPFANLSGDKDLEYFGDGLAEELLNRLATVSTLRVTARTSAFSFKGRDVTVQDIGSALGVAHVIEGSVRRSKDQLRITVQLVDARIGYHIWSQTYDRPLADIFQVQDEIAQAVLDSLRVVLTSQQAEALRSHGTTDPEVFDLYLRGRHLYQRMDVDGLATGIRYLRTVIERDPSFATAYIALADALSIQAQVSADPRGFGKDSDAHTRIELLDTALRLDPTNADAVATRANELYLSLDLDRARLEFERAAKLEPNTELALRYLGQYFSGVGWPPEKGFAYLHRGQQRDPLNPWAIVNLGIGYQNLDKFERALEMTDRALELDPSFWVAWWVRSFALFNLDRYDESADAARRALELSRGYPDLNADLVLALAMGGQLDEARTLFETVDAPEQATHWRTAYRAVALAGIGRHAEALDDLETAVRVGDGYVIEQLDHCVFVPLHGNPRFDRLVAELGQERRVKRLRDRLAADPR